MHALVTGGAGFIGSTLVDRLLRDGHRVEVVDDLSSGSRSNLRNASRFVDRFSFHELDIRDRSLGSLVDTVRPSVIFHLAAQSSVAVSVEDPVLDGDVNVVGSLKVLEAARRACIRKVVFAASGGTLYGSPPREELPVNEAHPHAPASPYGIAKRTVVDYLHAYRELYGLDFTALALANVYGPRQSPFGEAGVIAIFAEALVSGHQVTIYGDGEQTRDFVYVEDVVDGFVRAATMGSGLVLNIGTGVQTSVRELYEAARTVVGGGPQAGYGPARDGEIRYSALDPELAWSQLGWRAGTNLLDGLATVVQARRDAHFDVANAAVA